MATPTPSGGSSLPQKRPLGGPSTPSAMNNVSTPKSHLTPTNAPLSSIASPSASRVIASPAKRSSQFSSNSPRPAGTPSKASTLASKTIPGHLAANTSSPAANHPTGSSSGGANGTLLGMDSPAHLGLHLGALGAGEGGVGMGLTMSSLGISASAMGRADDEERRRRLEMVLQTLKKRPGNISAEALERLCKRSGLSFMEETRADGRKTLSMAGETFLLDVVVAPGQADAVDKVDLSFPILADRVANHADSAAAVLKQNLQSTSPTSHVWTTLERFAENLERLARPDKLSIAGANCFEAVGGIYTSLLRLYKRELDAAEKLLGAKNDRPARKAEYEVLCKKSGVPRMHAHGRIGLSLDYWVQDSLLPQSAPDKDSMDIDSAETVSPDAGVFSMMIECEGSLPALYTPIRISEDWISKEVVKSDIPVVTTGSDLGLAIDWQEPAAPLIPNPLTDGDTSAAAFNNTQPRARFVARLEPPVHLPWQIASQILSTVGISLTQDPTKLTTYDDGVLPDPEPLSRIPGIISETREVHAQRSVPVPEDASSSLQSADFDVAIHFPKRDIGYLLEELPFEHPRQIINILPILRQYVFIASIFRNTAPATCNTPTGLALQNGASREPAKRQRSAEDELADLLRPSAIVPRTIDIAYVNIPSPHFTVVVPRTNGLAKATLSVTVNADVAVVEQTFASDANTDKDIAEQSDEAARLSKALAVTEDFAVWAAWVRRKYKLA